MHLHQKGDIDFLETGAACSWNLGFENVGCTKNVPCKYLLLYFSSERFIFKYKENADGHADMDILAYT